MVIFFNPILDNVDTLASILADFGEASGLVTNFTKSLVVPIQCSNVDLDMVLVIFPTVRASFFMPSLGLPLSTHCLRKVEFQFLENTVAAKLPIHIGKHLTVSEWCTWMKFISTSQVSCRRLFHRELSQALLKFSEPSFRRLLRR